MGWLDFLKRSPRPDRDREDLFAGYYERNKWTEPESRSGSGSTLEQTRALREALPALVRELGCASLLDVPCGDFNWMSQVDLTADYIGADIVEALARSNSERFASPRRSFLKLDLLNDPLPRADLVLCRDCLVHFSFEDIRKALENIRSSGSTYLLTTTFPARRGNRDVHTGGWRALNLERPPLGFPAPHRRIQENCTERSGRFADKSLGLWRIADLG